MARIIEEKAYMRTDKFEIVDKFPADYIVWNIGRSNFNHKCFIPLAQRKSNNPEELEYYHINLGSLKAIRVESEELALFIIKKNQRKTVDCRRFESLIKQFNKEQQ